jgi:U2 small nuclear ribonucleoprotein B''
MPEPQREDEPEEATAQPARFGAAPAKAVPVNSQQDAAKGQKRAREEDEEENEDEDAEMEMDVSDEDSD